MSSTGSFLTSLCSQFVASACCASCSNQGPYHRHCGCSLHDGYWKFEGPSSPKCQVKIPNKKARIGMFRSISVQNLGEKNLSASGSSGSISDTHSPFDESRFENQQELGGESCKLTGGGNNPTVVLMEELATLIQEMKDGDVDSEGMCCDEDGGSRASDQKRIFLYRSGMFRSDTNLCAYAGPDPESLPVVAPVEIDLPCLLPQSEVPHYERTSAGSTE